MSRTGFKTAARVLSSATRERFETGIVELLILDC